MPTTFCRLLKISLVLAPLVGGLLLATPAAGVVVFSENFEAYDPDANLHDAPSPWIGYDTSNGSMRVRTDPGTYFGPNNQYFDYDDNNLDPSGENPFSGNPKIGVPLTGVANAAVRLSWDFYEPTASQNWTRMTLSTGTAGQAEPSAEQRSTEILVGGGIIRQGGGDGYRADNAYTIGQMHHIDVIANYGTASYSYNIGGFAGAVAPQRLDILLNGQLVGTAGNLADDLEFRNPETIRTYVDQLSIYAQNNQTTQMFIDNIVVDVAAPYVTIDRTTGNITLINASGAAIENIAGYSITSGAATLNSSSGVWNALSDGSDPSWEKLTGEPGSELSEISLNPPYTTLNLANGGTIDFGDVWHRHYAEDVQFELLLEDSSPEGLIVPVYVQYVGGAGGHGPFAQGDLNFDGVVDGLDVEHFGSYYYTELNQTTPGASYAFGDLNGDLATDYDDLALFRSIYDAAHGEGAFALALSVTTAVPEPASLLMLGAVIGGMTLGRRRWARKMAASVALLASLALLPAAQADIVFQENFDAIPADTVLDEGVLDGTIPTAFSTRIRDNVAPNEVRVVADAGDLFGRGAGNHYLHFADNDEPSGRPGLTGPADLTHTNVFELSFDFLDPTLDAEQNLRIGLTDANEDNASKPLDFQFRNGLFNYRSQEGVFDVPYTIGQNYSVRAVGNFGATPIIYNNGQDWIAPQSFDVWVKGGMGDFEKVSDNVPMSNNAPKTTHLSVGSTGPGLGDIYFDEILVHDTIDSFTLDGEALLTLRVNTETGNVSIRNGYGFDFSLNLDTYHITGETGSFNLAAWNSLDDQEGADGPGEGWVAAESSNSSMLREFSVDGTFAALGGNQSLNLGNLFNTSADTGGLSFQYAFDNGPLVTGLIELVTGAGLIGDFNNDGIVDAADYTVWRNNLGGNDSVLNGNGNNNGVVDIEDYDLWKNHFGSTATGAVVLSPAQVPEPATYATLMLAACGLLLVNSRRKAAMGRAIAVGLPLIAMLAIGCSALAAVSPERHYTLGDYNDGFYFEGSSPANGPDGGPVMANAPDVDVLESLNFFDLAQAGDPVYASVVSGVYARPGATGYGIRFDGVDDVLSGTAQNALSLAQTQGMQMWVYPAAAKLGSGAQAIAIDTSNAGGPAISATGMWTLVSSNHDDLEGSVPVVGDTWHHVAQHIWITSDRRSPQVVPGSGNPADYTNVIYVNGVAVAANNDSSVNPAIGAFQLGGAGATPDNFFQGVIDELHVYTSQPDEFDFFSDNDWVANRIAQIPGGVLKPGDINFDGVVDSGDVDLFIEGWRNEKQLVGANNTAWVGDWETRGWGDFNLDGRVDLRDALVLHRALKGTGVSLNFALLPGANVPEPNAVLLLGLFALAGIAVRRHAGR